MVRWVYRALLRIYPPDHRRWFGDEMRSVFEEAAREHRGRGPIAYAAFLFSECAGLIGGSAMAWTANLAGRGYIRRPELIGSGVTATLPLEVQQAQDRLNISLNGLLHAIANHQFVQARAFAAEEQKAREELRVVREKYHIAE
jgi:hypothetical protein